MTDLHRGLPFPRRAIAIVTMCTGSMLLMIDSSIAGIALPTIAKELDVSDALVVLLVTAYQLILAMTALPFAALGDRIGHRRLYQAGLLLHCCAGVLSFFANNLPAVVALRSLQALGASAALSVTAALVRAIFPLEKLGSGLSVNTIANAGGTALAPVVGGLILSVAGWHWVFAAAAPFSVAALVLSRSLPDPVPRKHRFDLLGAALCALTFGLIISGLECAIHSSHLAVSIGIVGFGAMVSWVFVRHELGESRPVLPVDLLTMPAIALSVISCFIATIGSIVLLLSMPFRLQHGYGFDPGEIGGMMASYAVVVLIVAPTAGFLSDRIPVAVLTLVAMILASIGLVFIAFLPIHSSHFAIAWRMGLCGVGFGMFSTPNARLIIASAPATRTASAGSIFSTTRMLSLALGTILVAALLEQGWGEGPTPALVAMCLSAIVGVISISRLGAVKHLFSTADRRTKLFVNGGVDKLG